MVWGLGLGVLDSGFGVVGRGLRVQGFEVEGLSPTNFEGWDFGVKVWVVGFEA